MMMEDFIFFVMFVAFVSGVGLLILWKLFDVTRNSIKKNKDSYDKDQFDRLAKAFIEYRKNTNKRLENIEAIITGENANQHQLDQAKDIQTIESVNFDNNRQQNISGAENKQRSQ